MVTQSRQFTSIVSEDLWPWEPLEHPRRDRVTRRRRACGECRHCFRHPDRQRDGGLELQCDVRLGVVRQLRSHVRLERGSGGDVPGDVHQGHGRDGRYGYRRQRVGLHSPHDGLPPLPHSVRRWMWRCTGAWPPARTCPSAPTPIRW